MFSNRRDAGQQLARALEKFRGQRPLILGLPRGGVVVATEVARALAGDLDVVLVKKLRAPDNPELAIGAVSEDGRVSLNHELVNLTATANAYIESERRVRLDEMAVQRTLYRQVKPRVPIAGRVAILVDDGLATGATMLAAVQATRLAAPHRLIVAVPVAPPETLRLFDQADDVVCLDTPTWFQGVGQFYEDFTQTSDAEVAELLRS